MLQFIQDNVGHCVVHVVRALLYIGDAFCEDGIRLVDGEDGRLSAGAHELAVVIEDFLHILLALANPLALDGSEIDPEDVPSRVLGKGLQRCGLAGAWASVEHAADSLRQTLGLEPFLHLAEVFVLQKFGQSPDLLLLGSVVEEFLLLDVLAPDEALVVDLLRGCEFNLVEPVILHVIRKGYLVGFNETVLVAEGDEPLLLQVGSAVREMASQHLVVFHKFNEVHQYIQGHGLVPFADIAVAQIEEHPPFSVRTFLREEGRPGHLAAEQQLVVPFYQTDH